MADRNYRNNNNDFDTNKAQHDTNSTGKETTSTERVGEHKRAGNFNDEQENRMTRSEAGRKGGEAHHVCRGRECNEESSRKKSSSKKDKDDSGWNIF